MSQIQAELLKIRSTRTTVGLLLGMVGLVLLTVLLTGLLSTAATLTDKQNQLGLLGDGSLAGVFAALVFGILGEGLGFGIGYVILNARGIPIALGGSDFTVLLVGALVGVALWGAIGVGLGAI